MDAISVGNWFCNTYLLIENNRWGYVILSGGEKIPTIEGPVGISKPELKIHCIDTVPHIVIQVKPRFVKAIYKVASEPDRIYHLLLSKLSESDIKKFFYKLWLFDHNRKARKANLTEMSRINHLKKIGSLRKSDGAIGYLTQRLTVRSASREYGAI